MSSTTPDYAKRYRSQRWALKANRDRNRSMAKMPREQLSSAVDTYDRILAESTAIRARHGLAPVVDGETIRAARKRLAELPARKTRKRAKCQGALTPDGQLAEIAKRRREIERERVALDAEVAALAASGSVKVSAIAKALGVSRQRVYQLSAA